MVNLDSKRLEDILKFLSGIFLILILNNLAARTFFRVDLTEENRFSLSPSTKELLRNLSEVAYIDVYLAGDLPAGMDRFQRAIRETLDEFRVYAGNNIQYNFIDPGQAAGSRARNEFMMSLAAKGIQPTNIFATENGKRVEKLIFPGAVVSYAGQESGVMLFKGNKGAAPQERLNQSIEGVEYELASAIQKMANFDLKTVALIRGHQELDSLGLVSITRSLNEFYEVIPVHLPSTATLIGYDVILVAKPETPFSEEDKYKIDQYLMAGGKAIFMIDPVLVQEEELGTQGTVALPVDLNLSDLFFRYGFRFNNMLIRDLNSGFIPVVTGNLGEQPQVSMMPWPYFLMVNQYSEHPVVKNMDAVYLRYASTIDTVKAEGIKKTPLLFSSQYSSAVPVPLNISLNDIRQFMNQDNPPTGGPYPLAYLLEGSFTSLYQNRVLPPFADPKDFRSKGEPAAIVAVADGDFIRNELDQQTGQPRELDYNPFMPQNNFANKDLLLNTLSYLLAEDGLIMARAKEIQIRPLDKVKIENEKTFWQVLNLLAPILLLLLFGLIKWYLRKRKFTGNQVL